MNTRPGFPPFRRRSERGFSMIELLIVAFIMAIGLMGLFALQVIGVSSGTQSRQRGTASLLAHSLLDRVTSEGLVSAGERAASQNGTITTAPAGVTRWVFIDPTGFTAHTSSEAEDYYYDLAGDAVTATSPNLMFTVSWQRLAGAASGPTNAIQPFVINVKWNESISTSTGTSTVTPQYFSVSRNVRL
jgi:type IV pilus modification protein PilV